VLDHWTEENEPIRVTLYHVPDDNSKESRKFIGCNTVRKYATPVQHFKLDHNLEYKTYRIFLECATYKPGYNIMPHSQVHINEFLGSKAPGHYPLLGQDGLKLGEASFTLRKPEKTVDRGAISKVCSTARMPNLELVD
jgi:hypothetical protein